MPRLKMPHYRQPYHAGPAPAPDAPKSKNLWKPGDRVRVISGAAFSALVPGAVYTVKSTGLMHGHPIVWMEEIGGTHESSILTRAEHIESGSDAILRELKEAYRAKRAAEVTLERLRKYKHLSASMKYDRERAHERVDLADKTMHRLLGGAP